MRILFYLTFTIGLLLPAPAMSNFITSPEEFAASKDVTFTWNHARSRSVQIFLEYREESGAWRRVTLGSGFLLSADGLFITAYHVMKHCLASERGNIGLSAKIDCSTQRPGVRYVAINEGREFPIEVISYLKEADSTSGKDNHTPDEIIKQRDFVVGKLQNDDATFPFWRVRDFDQAMIDVENPNADFQLTPLLPPKRVFIAGFPADGDFVMSEGFLNLTEKNRRGYFAVDMKVYTTPYLESQGVATDTKWGLRIENHMSGGAVIDSSGYVVGLVVNGNERTAGILSIENILATFFSRAGKSGARPAVFLNPTNTPLFLKGQSMQTSGRVDPPVNLISRSPFLEFSFVEKPDSSTPAYLAFWAPPYYFASLPQLYH